MEEVGALRIIILRAEISLSKKWELCELFARERVRALLRIAVLAHAPVRGVVHWA